MNDSAKPAESAAEAKSGSNEPPAAKYTISGGFATLLNSLKLSVAVTSYQSGRLYLLSQNPKGGLNVDEQMHKKAMGLHYDGKSLLLATLANIYRMENVLRADQAMDEIFNHCFVPRTAHFTGVLDAHDVGVTSQGEILFVNTRYNCLASVSNVHSFKVVWKPDFISKIVAEDRCHLNGMAMQDGEARYVTAVSKSDTIDGWRDRRADGGIVMDVAKNEIICEGLSMPHSPRVHGGKLWVLNSGSGELGWIEGAEKDSKGKFNPLCFCPGFVRGLSFHGSYAFVGLSKPRYERFEGLELDSKLAESDSEPWCGVQVIDLNTGSCVQWFRIDGEIGELYDVAVLPDVGCAKSLGFETDEALGVITLED